MKNKRSRVESRSADMLGALTDTVTAQMPEEVFKKYFLDLFMGRSPDEELLYVKWVDLAGGRSSPMEIIDEDDVVVFTIPGMINYTGTITEAFDGVSFNRFAEEQTIKANRLLVHGEQHLAENIDKWKELVGSSEAGQDPLGGMRKYYAGTPAEPQEEAPVTSGLRGTLGYWD